jgi:hypothetical protein
MVLFVKKETLIQNIAWLFSALSPWERARERELHR